MSRIKRKIPHITFSRQPSVALTDKNWQAIEKSYHHQVPGSARTQITVATERFLQFAQAEMSAPSLAPAIRRAEKLRNAGRALVRAIGDRPIDSAIRLYVDEELGQSYALLNVVGKRFPLHNYVAELSLEVSRFVNAGDDTLEYFQKYVFWPDGGAWQVWIRDLVQILEAHDLPIAARKDLSKTSPFVTLVGALQVFIPERHARARYSDGALASAINKARHETKPPTARAKTTRRAAKRRIPAA